MLLPGTFWTLPEKGSTGRSLLREGEERPLAEVGWECDGWNAQVWSGWGWRSLAPNEVSSFLWPSQEEAMQVCEKWLAENTRQRVLKALAEPQR